MTEEVKTWVGSSIEEIMSGISCATIRQAPKIESSDEHTILFQIPLPDDENSFPIPMQAEDKWDDLHVKLPCSPNSTYREINLDGERVTKLRWDLIKETLNSPIKSSRDLENAIKAYNNKFEKIWNFKSLHELFEDEFSEDDNEYIFDDLLPAMIKLALDLPTLFQAPLPLLRQQLNHSVSMSQQQVACLLANAFFCTFPNRSKRNSDYPEINFNRLFCCVGPKIISKLKCILNYFRVVLLVDMPKGVITFQRRCIENFPDWSQLNEKFSSIKWQINSSGKIEDAHHMLQVDFANRYLGGGVLGSGCVQEEIRFMINPECIVGMLFCESMKANEAIYIYGSEQYSDYKGYASSFEWSGNHKEKSLERDEYRRKTEYIVAIDALAFHKPTMQFKEFAIRRELNKAFCGFYSTDKEAINIPVATGNWGCGAFCGYNRLKCLIQLIACVANGRNLVYYTFSDYKLQLEMEEMFEFLQENDITIAQLWKYLTSFNASNNFKFLYHHIHEQFLADKEIEGFENYSESDIAAVDVLEERCVEGSSANVENLVSQTHKEDCVIDMPDDDIQPTEEVLEKPTKRMKIDDECSSEKVNEIDANEVSEKVNEIDANEVTESVLQAPLKNKLITDFFTKTPK